MKYVVYNFSYPFQNPFLSYFHFIYKDGEQAAFHLSFYFPFRTLLIKGILSAIPSFKFCMILQNLNHSLNKGALYLFILVAYKGHKDVETSSGQFYILN